MSSHVDVDPAILESPALAERAQWAAVAATQQMRRRWAGWYKALGAFERFADVIAAALGTVGAEALYWNLGIGRHIHYQQHSLIMSAIAVGFAFMILLDLNGGYDHTSSLLQIRETERILRATAQTVAVTMVVAFVMTQLVSRWLVVFAAVITPLAVIIEKNLLLGVVRSLHARGIGVERVAVYGAGDTGRRLVTALLRSPKLGLQPVLVIDDNASHLGPRLSTYGYRHDLAVPVVEGPMDPEKLRQEGISTVISAIPTLPRERFDHMSSALEAKGIRVCFIPKMTTGPGHSVSYMHVDGLVIGSRTLRHTTSWSAFAKRMFDLVFATTGLLFIAPSWLLIALWVKLDSRGPVLFSQMRVGKDGKLFKMYKFRSMYTDAPKYGYHPKSSTDSRITRAGKWLRRTSIDELPQILNVIKGDMSLVGPRPEMPFIVDSYTTYHRQRLEVAPGITGLWQLSADRANLIHENIHYDLYYIRNRTFFMDVAILFHTVVFAVRGI